MPAELCIETGGRLAADASLVEALNEQELEILAARLRELAPRAVAINLLFSFLDDRFERQIEQHLPDTLFISRSSDILPEQGEYERGIATWLNAWVGPRVQGYVQRLQQSVQPAPVHVMQSSAFTIRADQAAKRAVNLLLSGPAGGLMGARRIGDELDRSQLLTLDLRYHGQSYTLNIPFHDLKQAAADFHRVHQQRFGHKLDSDVELVNLRVALSASGSDLSLQACDHQTASHYPIEQAVLAGFDRPVPVWRRDDLACEAVYTGPLLIIDTVATSYVAAGWTASRHRSGCLLLDRL